MKKILLWVAVIAAVSVLAYVTVNYVQKTKAKMNAKKEGAGGNLSDRILPPSPTSPASQNGGVRPPVVEEALA